MKPITCFGFEIPTAIIKSTPFGDVTLCCVLEVHRRFGGTCCLHLYEALKMALCVAQTI
jgi:hypothetical protein